MQQTPLLIPESVHQCEAGLHHGFRSGAGGGESEPIEPCIHNLVAGRIQGVLNHLGPGMAHSEATEVVGDGGVRASRTGRKGGQQQGIVSVEISHGLGVACTHTLGPLAEKSVCRSWIHRGTGSSCRGGTCEAGTICGEGHGRWHGHGRRWTAKQQQPYQNDQLPGNRRVRQSPLAVLTSTPISTGSWAAPNCCCHQAMASAQAASRES